MISFSKVNLELASGDLGSLGFRTSALRVISQVASNLPVGSFNHFTFIYVIRLNCFYFHWTWKAWIGEWSYKVFFFLRLMFKLIIFYRWIKLEVVFKEMIFVTLYFIFEESNVSISIYYIYETIKLTYSYWLS